MPRWIGPLLAVLLPLSLLAGLAAGLHRPGMPAEASRALLGYMARQQQAGGGAWAAQSPVRATRPWRFARPDSSATYGASLVFQISFNDWSGGSLPGARPLPYPPVDAWCVTLQSPGPNPARSVVLALHQDLYNATWVLHELGDASPTLADIGCRTPTSGSE